MLKVLNYIKDQRAIKVNILDMKLNKGKTAAIRVDTRYFYHGHNVDYIRFTDVDISIELKNFKKQEQFIFLVSIPIYS